MGRTKGSSHLEFWSRLQVKNLAFATAQKGGKGIQRENKLIRVGRLGFSFWPMTNLSARAYRTPLHILQGATTPVGSVTGTIEPSVSNRNEVITNKTHRIVGSPSRSVTAYSAKILKRGTL